VSAAFDPAPLRVFLFKREFVDVFHLRLAVGMAFERMQVDVLDQNEAGMSTARAIVRSRNEVPTLVLFEQRRRGPRTIEALRRIRGLPELRALPVVVLGDGEEADSVLHAHEDGADGFIPLPERASELPRIGRDVAQFWWNRQFSKSA
jgi:CheY-like chemotaxis protein